jgi:hypothetical protein
MRSRQIAERLGVEEAHMLEFQQVSATTLNPLQIDMISKCRDRCHEYPPCKHSDDAARARTLILKQSRMLKLDTAVSERSSLT